MADPVFCDKCGARNPVEAEWCGQCFAALVDGPVDDEEGLPVDEPAQVISVGAEGETPPDVVEVGVKSESRAPSGEKTWVCSACDMLNPFSIELCAACGTSLFASFGAEAETREEVDPRRTLIRSIVFPGLGHAYAHQGLLGSAIGGVTVMALGFGITLAVTNRGRFGWPLILLAMAIWVAAALDAVRIAGTQTTEGVLLRPRVVTALVGVVVVVVILAAMTAQGST